MPPLIIRPSLCGAPVIRVGPKVWTCDLIRGHPGAEHKVTVKETIEFTTEDGLIVVEK